MAHIVFCALGQRGLMNPLSYDFITPQTSSSVTQCVKFGVLQDFGVNPNCNVLQLKRGYADIWCHTFGHNVQLLLRKT